MILTGKAKEDFLKHEGQPEIWYNLMQEFPTMLHALIIEWFDSVGSYVNVGGVSINGILDFGFDIQENNTLNGIDGFSLNSRQEATEQAIIKANEIYNER